jgi:hypothetical protein
MNVGPAYIGLSQFCCRAGGGPEVLRRLRPTRDPYLYYRFGGP